MSNERTMIFVYGTLMSGLRLNPVLQGERAVLVEKDAVLPGHALVDVGAWFPGVIPLEGHQVRGELYSVDENALAHLDQVEGCPTLYRRERCRVAVEGGEHGAWFYCWAGRADETDVYDSDSWRDVMPVREPLEA